MSWSRIVHAAVKLTPTAKLVWDEIRLLDGGSDGAWITAKTLGRRLALDERNVERVRSDLQRCGLLTSERRTGRMHWFVRLPDGCVPPSARPSDDTVFDLASRLDIHIGEYA